MILITGASGFVGQHLLLKLSAHGTPIRALYNNTPPSPAFQNIRGVEWLKCDLLDVYDVEEVIAGITEVYHCAAIVSFDPAKKELMLAQNVTGTAHIVDAALEAGVRKLVAVSSVASLGRGIVKDALITEVADWEESNRNSAYATSKYFAEMEVWRAIGEGLNAVIVNPAIILGEGNWEKGSAKLIKVVDGEFPFFTSGINGWVDVEDVVCAMILLMQSSFNSERYIVSGGNFSYREIFTKMATALGRKPPGISVSAPLARLIAGISLIISKITSREPTITPETARTALEQCFYDNSKLLKAFPDFRYTPVETTIKRMSDAYISDTKAAAEA